MANPIQAYINTFNGTGGQNESNVLTFSFAITAAFEAWIPIRVLYPNTTGISAGAEVYTYRSTDGGATYETVKNFASFFPKPTAASQIDKRDIQLFTGQYLVAVQVGGNGAAAWGTWSVEFGTAWVITAYS
jgi:hypothetical protein